MTIVCIAGMHRSGTSMIARLLNLCGLYLGESSELVAPALDNPEGFWEHSGFNRINDEILSRLQGAWDVPPVFKPEWQASRQIFPLRSEARSLINQFDGQQAWGWKDPRNSLTLPFWRDLIPGLKVIVCLRNPLEVARSLDRRGYASKVFSMNLWRVYNQIPLDAIPVENRVVTHYDSYFVDPQAELRRLLDFAGIRAEEAVIQQACSSILDSMRHAHSTTEELTTNNAPADIIALYATMCSLAGPVKLDTSRARLPSAATSPVKDEHPESGSRGPRDGLTEQEQLFLQAKLAEQETAISVLNAGLASQGQAIVVLTAQTSAQEQTIKTITAQVVEKEQATQALTAQLVEKEQAAEALKVDMEKNIQAVQLLQSRTRDLELQLYVLQSGLAFRLMGKYRSSIERFLPAGTSRRRLYDLGMKGLQVLISEGPRSLWRRVRARNGWGPSRPHSVPDNSGRTSFAAARAGNRHEYVPLASTGLSVENLPLKLIAFYLPQFHPIPENDQWWGKGFTEWTNVSRGVPQFVGHYQPRLPGELGFYDLRVPEVQRRQVTLAQKYGISGFCFYYYWFDGKRLLDRPLNQFSTDPEIDFPFCLCWANENWTRRWDGRDDQVLIAQGHSEESDFAFIKDIEPLLRHKNYIRIHDRPVLLVYRTQLLPDPAATAKRWRQYCRDAGLGDPYLVAAQVFDDIDPRQIGFDAAVEFPPNTPVSRTEITKAVAISNPDFSGNVFRYADMAERMINRSKPPYQLYKTVFPGWDNTARRLEQGTTFAFGSPDLYEYWLTKAGRFALADPDLEKRIVFINAWNEWAEGAYLEPDQRYGYAYLQATANAITSLAGAHATSSGDWKILFVSHDAHRGGAQAVLLNTIAWFRAHTGIRPKVLCLQGGVWLSRFEELADTVVLEMHPDAVDMTETEIASRLINLCQGVPDLIYGNSVASGGIYSTLAKLGAPIITHFHELERSIQRYGGVWMDEITEHSSHFIACSLAVRDNLTGKHHIDPLDVATVYSSIPADSSLGMPGERERKQLRRRLGLKQGVSLIFGCGLSMPFRKGADLFIEVARILRRKGRDDFCFYWIGDFGQNETDITQGIWADNLAKLKREGLQKFVTFLGVQDSSKDYLLAGDIFILPSREDPFPLVVLEAAECGLPSVCFANAGGAPDFVGEDAGFVVPFEDAEAMADKVITLLENEKLRHSLGTRAREKFLHGFTVDRVTPHILSVCRQVAGKKPAVSVIVPGYNHAQYLPQRLESIFNQTFQDFEVIILDDASTDNSFAVIQRYAGFPDVRIIQNEQNSGSSFKQWIKGIDLAQADIIWIAESDDLCSTRFLETLLPAFDDPVVKLAYANSDIINVNGEIVGDYIESDYLTSLSSRKWKTNYRVSSNQEINEGLGVKNTILSASAVIFRKINLDSEARQILENMHFAGDWYFIVNAIKGGDVYYNSNKLNYHRRHTESVIGKMVAERKVEIFFREFHTVQRFIFENYALTEKFCGNWENYLRKQWNDFFPGSPVDELEVYYPLKEMRRMLLQKSREENRNNKIIVN
jgi:glycosyltransferase involved in cell wall biosynthesis